MKNYLFKGSHASRAAAEPVWLQPPLREGWDIEYGDPPACSEGRVFFGGGRCVCRDEATGAKRWAVPFKHGVGPCVVWRDRVIVQTIGTGTVLLDCTSGAKVAELAWPVVLDVALVGQLWLGYTQDEDLLYGADISDGRIIWRYPLKSQPIEDTQISAVFSASPKAVFIGRRDGRIQAISLADGQLVWEASVAHLRSGPAGQETHGSPRRWSFVFSDVVIFQLWENWAVGLSASTGEIVWQHQFPSTISDAQLYDGRYYVVTSGRGYHILDAASGALALDARLTDLPDKLRRMQITTLFPILVSETHLFGGVDIGVIMAFERETGKYVWHYKQTHAGNFQRQTYFMSVNGRLFYAELSGHLHCLEEVHPTDPTLLASRATDSRAPVKRAARGAVASRTGRRKT
jgi:outer membrane protein assembly factor BamB